ncbi:MAG: hypothetical protein LBN39_00800 [Planctomycetaceae bacterium]|jgi:hypothetical protein|nr:hypothetical protein [Planctomycetaceae bacterium]
MLKSPLVYVVLLFVFTFFTGCNSGTEDAAAPNEAHNEGAAVNLAGQKSLKLDKTETSDAGIAKLAADNPDLVELTLGETKIQNLDEALLSLKKLKKIRVSSTNLTSAGVTLLSKIETLEDVDVSQTNLGDMDLMLLAQLPNLKRLNLYTTKITNFGLDFLKDFKSAGTLIWLNIDKNTLDDAAIPKLAPLTNLEWLHLGRTGLTDEGLYELAKIKTLKEVSITNTKVSKDGVAKLQAALPNCKVNANAE